MLDLNKLSSVQFEEFTHDLLLSMGFQNLNWRKGSGYNASPSDQGRDIEAEFFNTDIDGEKRIEKWFVECKHYKQGVPAEKINSALRWAESNRPDVLLFVISNFFSNQAKECLNAYQQNNKPKFIIKIWENKKLEELTFGKAKLLRSYNIPYNKNNTDLFNPNHVTYISRQYVNSIPYFLTVLDSIKPEIRDTAFELTYIQIIHNTFINESDFQHNFKYFKKKCLMLYHSPTMSNTFFVHQIVLSTLSWLFHTGNPLELPDVIERNKKNLEYLKSKKASSDIEKTLLTKEINRVISHIDQLPTQTSHYWDIYNAICDEVIPKLLIEYQSQS